MPRLTGFGGLVVSVLLAVAGAATAGDATHSAKGVIELFTSQGCSSCPPADRAFAELAEDHGVIAISYHVDYWNYRGWEDTLSDKRFSDRQYGYAAALGRSNVFTPQAVINGRADVTASDLAAMRGTIEAMANPNEGLAVPVSATMGAEELMIDVGAGTGKADLVIAYIKEKATVTVERGENAGKTIDYAHVVVDLATVGMWEGKAMQVKLPRAVVLADGHDGCAILLQRRDEKGHPSAIIGAALIDDYQQN